jgi:response regulator RpfG family c-di-GMP phosphodiesterase
MRVDVYTSLEKHSNVSSRTRMTLQSWTSECQPDMTGFQLYREMKKCDPSITTCFLSAFEIQADEFKSVFQSIDGVKAIIKKPLSINELLIEIAPFLKILLAARAASG